MLSGIGGGALEVAGFELVYVTAPGDGVRVGLADAWALPLESVPPVRRFASYRGQRHLSGCWISSSKNDPPLWASLEAAGVRRRLVISRSGNGGFANLTRQKQPTRALRRTTRLLVSIRRSTRHT